MKLDPVFKYEKDSEIVPVKFMGSLASFVFAQWLSFGCDPQARES